MRLKLLHFSENHRPPFFGSFRATSRVVRPRRPLAMDTAVVDYEGDSDLEWEEEEPGERCVIEIIVFYEGF